MIPRPGTRLTWIYLLTQGGAGLTWWVWLYIIPDARDAFTPEGLPGVYIFSYALPDALLFVLGSLLTAFAFALRLPVARAMLWVLAGAIAYATLHCVGLHLRFGGYLAPSMMMLASCICTWLLALTSNPDDSRFPTLPFRTASPGSVAWALTRTTLQIVVFWGAFLLILPRLIVLLESAIGIHSFDIPGIIGWTVFALSSVLGLWSAWCMAVIGKGTPLPTDHAPLLVTRGPYRFVRNPMVVAGLLQGVGVMLVLGSWLMIPYVVLGGIFWQLCIRPIEERDMLDRFGDTYEVYRDRVPCWRMRVR